MHLSDPQAVAGKKKREQIRNVATFWLKSIGKIK